MNRLIIVGNGFDLAHQMKTSYHDFLLDYLNASFKIARERDSFVDELIEIRKGKFCHGDEFYSFKKVQDFSRFIILGNKTFDDMHENDLENQFSNHGVSFIWVIKNEYIKSLLTRCFDYNWVDIENEYYQELISILLEMNFSTETRQRKILTLNKSFQYIIEKLKVYISRQSADKNIDYLGNPIAELLKKPLNYSNMVSLSLDDINEILESIANGKLKTDGLGETIFPKDTLILNFNYTNTITSYLENSFLKKELGHRPKLNYIHGEHSKEIIFGFGDEIDDRYPLIEKTNNNDYLKYIKSFGYFKNENYRDLIRFIDSKMFEVFIWGHSCGLSDRTMLNMVFEHKNCKSIKIFHHKISETENNYTTLTQEISRHFKDKSELRKKIVPFENRDYLPQITR